MNRRACTGGHARASMHMYVRRTACVYGVRNVCTACTGARTLRTLNPHVASRGRAAGALFWCRRAEAAGSCSAATERLESAPQDIRPLAAP
jgi:hypothetical protein